MAAFIQHVWRAPGPGRTERIWWPPEVSRGLESAELLSQVGSLLHKEYLNPPPLSLFLRWGMRRTAKWAYPQRLAVKVATPKRLLFLSRPPAHRRELLLWIFSSSLESPLFGEAGAVSRLPPTLSKNRGIDGASAEGISSHFNSQGKQGHTLCGAQREAIRAPPRFRLPDPLWPRGRGLWRVSGHLGRSEVTRTSASFMGATEQLDRN